jgi:hypothetical protein
MTGDPGAGTQFASLNNKFLLVKKNVTLTGAIDLVIAALDGFFGRADLKSYVTSGLRSPEQQLDLIRFYSHLHHVDEEFHLIKDCGLVSKSSWENGSVFQWQTAWSRLLNIGVIINPPLQAKALFDYMRDGVNKKGQLINQTPHTRGNCFDIGGAGGMRPDVTDELSIIKAAFDSGTIPPLSAYLVERKNNCIHCECTLADNSLPTPVSV